MYVYRGFSKEKKIDFDSSIFINYNRFSFVDKEIYLEIIILNLEIVHLWFLFCNLDKYFEKRKITMVLFIYIYKSIVYNIVYIDKLFLSTE